jgi:GxxExxY protein
MRRAVKWLRRVRVLASQGSAGSGGWNGLGGFLRAFVGVRVCLVVGGSRAGSSLWNDSAIHSALTRSVIGAFFEVYNTLGFGFLEHLYVMAMERELLSRGHRVARQVGVPVIYKGHPLGTQRLDLIVDDKLVVETKSTYELHRAATRQVYN